MIMKPYLALAMAVLPLTAGRLSAAPITYVIDFAVGSAVNTHGGPFDTSDPDDFDYEPAVGDIFYAYVTLDDAALSLDGDHRGVPLDGFRLEIAGLVWDSNDPASEFRGFRGPDRPAVSPILVSSGGVLIGLKGGVYGSTDIPFVDFEDNGSYRAYDGTNAISGGMQPGVPLPSVPEPGTLWTLGAGLAGLLAFSRRLLPRMGKSNRGPGSNRA
jgi:hypothetical protein